MNSRETEYSNDYTNSAKAYGANSADRAATAIGDTLVQAKDFMEEQSSKAASAIDKAACDASSTMSSAIDKTVSTVNDGIKASKDYLADQNLDKMADDVTGVIKKYPMSCLFAGIGMGIILGNALSRR